MRRLPGTSIFLIKMLFTHDSMRMMTQGSVMALVVSMGVMRKSLMKARKLCSNFKTLVRMISSLLIGISKSLCSLLVLSSTKRRFRVKILLTTWTLISQYLIQRKSTSRKVWTNKIYSKSVRLTTFKS